MSNYRLQIFFRIGARIGDDFAVINDSDTNSAKDDLESR